MSVKSCAGSSFWLAAIVGVLAVALPCAGQDRGERFARLDVDHYTIDAEINPNTQTISAVAKVHFTTLDNETSNAAFELNNALNVSKVTDDTGQQLSATRTQPDFTVRVGFPQALPKAKSETLTFTYDGRFAGNEESPVFGIRFAAIHDDHTFLLYPARWFPVYGYTTDRFSADLRITVPNGNTVIAAGDEKSDKVSADKTVYTFHYAKSSFPGSIAVVQGEPQRITADGVTTTFYLRSKRNVANAYGGEMAKIMTYLTSIYGLPPHANLTVVETEAGAPNGYSAPGILFLSPKSMTDQPATRLLANQIARQWWSILISPTTRNHMWLENGQARYAELLYTEHASGPGAFQTALHDTYVEALTVENPPLIQSSRLEDYSPEYWAATAGKGAAVLSMLRDVIGDKDFFQLLKAFPDHYSYRGVSTEDFRKAAESISGQDLQYFFIQWIESSGAPEFKLQYTVFRTQKGFRVMGKVSQDLDTFRMPVDLKIETEGNPEEKKIEVVGTSSEFTVDTFGKPKSVALDPDHKVLRFSNTMRVAVAIRRGEQYVEVGQLNDALKEYQKALDVNHNSSLAHYRVAEIFFMQNNYQAAANEFRDALNGDLDPRWTEVWSHLNLGKVFDITGQRDRAVNEYKQATRTKDNTQGALEEAAKYIQHPYQRKQSET